MTRRAAGPGKGGIEVEFFGGPADGLITAVPPVPGSNAPPLYYHVPTPAPPREPPDPPRTATYRRGRDQRDTGRAWLYRHCQEETGA